jgi:hypothetical protein
MGSLCPIAVHQVRTDGVKKWKKKVRDVDTPRHVFEQHTAKNMFKIGAKKVPIMALDPGHTLLY